MKRSAITSQMMSDRKYVLDRMVEEEAIRLTCLTCGFVAVATTRAAIQAALDEHKAYHTTGAQC